MIPGPLVLHPIPRRALDTVGSTNSAAWDLLEQGVRPPFWVTANRQTAGRGRGGRQWVSEPGNLYSSLVLPEICPPARMTGVPFVVALALHDAVCDIIGTAADRLAIKWPNDLLYDGAKLSGILIEGRNHDGVGPVTIIGIGINIAHHPEIDNYPTSDIGSIAGRTIPVDLVFEALSERMHQRFGLFDGGRGFARIREAWLERAVGIGRRIVVRMPDGEHSGTFEGLDESGRLLLRLPDGGRMEISAGDVFLGASGTDEGTRP